MNSLIGSLLTFAFAATLLTITPGPDTAMVLRQALSHGRRAGVGTAIGVALGLLGWGVAAAAGLAALLTSSAQVFTVFRVLCGVYLIWLAVQAFRSTRSAAGPPAQVPDHGRPGVLGSIRLGASTALLNPKLGVFFVAFLPAFLPSGVSVAVGTMVLAGVQAIIALTWYCGLSFLIVRSHRLLSRAGVRRAMQRITGVVFLGFGARLIAESI